MGQYYLIVNVTKRQYLDPHSFKGEFFLDDNLENCLLWQERYPKKTACIWDAPYNQQAESIRADIKRIRNLDEFFRRIEKE